MQGYWITHRRSWIQSLFEIHSLANSLKILFYVIIVCLSMKTADCAKISIAFQIFKIVNLLFLWSMQCEPPDTTQQCYQLLHQLVLYGDRLLCWWQCHWTVLSGYRDNRLLWWNSGHIPGEDEVCGFFVWLSNGNQEHCSAVWNHTTGVSIGDDVLVFRAVPVTVVWEKWNTTYF